MPLAAGWHRRSYGTDHTMSFDRFARSPVLPGNKRNPEHPSDRHATRFPAILAWLRHVDNSPKTLSDVDSQLRRIPEATRQPCAATGGTCPRGTPLVAPRPRRFSEPADSCAHAHSGKSTGPPAKHGHPAKAPNLVATLLPKNRRCPPYKLYVACQSGHCTKSSDVSRACFASSDEMTPAACNSPRALS